MKSVSDVVRRTSSALGPFATTDLIKRVRFRMGRGFDVSIKESIERAFGIIPEFNTWDPNTWNPWDGPEWVHEIIDDFEFAQMDEELEGLGLYEVSK